MTEHEHEPDLPSHPLPSPRALRIAAAVRWVLIAAFAALAAAGVVIGLDIDLSGGAPAEAVIYRCPMHPQITSTEPGSCPICGMDLVRVGAGDAAPVRRGTRWFCPDHPEIRSDRPGRCPLDAQPLVPMTVPGRTGVSVDETRLRAIGTVVVAAERRTLDAGFEAPAEIALDETRRAVVDTRLGGWATRVRVRAAGGTVRRGEPLATLTSRELFDAEAELAAALRAAPGLGEAGAALVGQARARLVAMGVPAAEIARVERGGPPRTELGLVAPRAGTVVAVGVIEGALVMPGTPLFTIADLDVVWVLADVPESRAAGVHEGATVHVTTPLDGERTWEGRVALREPRVDPGSRTRRVRVVVEGAAGALVPGASATVHFAHAVADAVTVPRDAVLSGASAQHVFVTDGEGHFEPRPVEIGAEVDGRVHVRRGLAAGERVAAHAAFLIDAESQLRAGSAPATDGGVPAAAPPAGHVHGSAP